MCGRYLITTPLEAIREAFGVDELPNLPARYNVAPTQAVPIVRRPAAGGGGRELALVRWGLIPSWAKEASIGNRLINARAETVAEKPAFRDSFARRRCLVIADGFYEWQAAPGGKQPYWIGMKTREPFAFAGLWAHWRDPESGETVPSCTIITTNANALCRPIHERMPVILARPDYDRWFDAPPAEAATLLRPFDPEPMEAYPVSRRVNTVRNEDAGLIEPINPK